MRFQEIILFIIYKCDNYVLYNRPDMGWEPVWHGLWIKQGGISEKISRDVKQVPQKLKYSE